MVLNKWLIYLLLFIGNICYGQNTAKKTPLTEVIISLEKQFNVKFSYAVEDVAIIKIDKPNASFTLQEIIDYLNSKTTLNFKALDDRYVTISVLNKTISVCGIVSDEKKSPLVGASILVNDIGKSTITDETGKFKLQNIPINAILSISYLGFESKQFEASELFSAQKNCKEIVLSAKNEELNQVLINVYLTPGLQKYLDGSTVLNTKKFGILPGLIEPDILQSIQALPGVESSNESIANINVRGGTNDQNLILWDNIKMYHSGHFFGLISAYNPNLTEKVVVSKNGTSAEYSDGVSSTISMYTKDIIFNTFTGGGGINLLSADAFLEIPIARNLALHISGRRSITELFKSPTYTRYFERSFQDSEINADSDKNDTSSDFYFYDYTAKLLFDLNEKHQFRANVIGINNALDYSERLTANSNTNQSKTSNLSQKNIGYGGNWKAQWSPKLSSNFNTYFSRYNIDATDYRVETDQRLTEANEVLETGVKLNTYYKTNEHLNFLVGYQLNETGMLNQTVVSNPSYSSTIKDVLRNHAVFSEAEFNKKNTYLRVGVRLNYFQKFAKFLVEPRINFRQKLSNEFALKLEGEFKNQSTTQIVDFEDDFLGVEKRRWVLVNNNDIPIAISKQGSVGVEFNKNKLMVDLTGFIKKVDGITASNQGFYNNFQYKNAHGSYIVKGIEFLANKTARNYSTWISYTFSVNDYEFEIFNPSTFPNNADIRHSISFGLNYEINKNLKASIGGIWRNGQPYTKPVKGDETVTIGNTTMVNYDSPNGSSLNNFMRLDASFSYNFNVTNAIKATVRAGIINLTNEDNIINRYYKVDPNNTDNAIKVDNKSLGLTPNVSFRVNF
ncbi:carboxypeptidase-like regulatory domain-containing protein [Flavobacterium sp. LB3P45]|uniref:Carboxypeptidase-like regulatory domain-containing protein n=1 Tax=Flavobacterium fructosi TaxID=3230416 RepID=A0ABW6HLC5_9FLAO